jgi:hypothetical protein
VSVGGPKKPISQHEECLYSHCILPPQENGFCRAHQAHFVDGCMRGEHDLCYEDGLSCCTCRATKDRVIA